jgi:hypothetical protein
MQDEIDYQIEKANVWAWENTSKLFESIGNMAMPSNYNLEDN